MKVFLVSSSPKADNHSALLLKYLQMNHEVFHYDHEYNEANDQYTFDDLVGEIASADVFVGEMSKASQTLGFQLSYALQLSKPSLYLYDSEQKGKPAGLIGNIPSRNLRIKSYDSKNLKNTIDEFMVFAERQMESARTSFMSTREIDEYLSSEAMRQGVSKGELIRQILHRSISIHD
jgi:hypothetical protein